MSLFDSSAANLALGAVLPTSKGVQNNPGQKLSDHDLLEYVRNIYAVLLTRGIRGTYLYVVDPHLREHLRRYFG